MPSAWMEEMSGAATGGGEEQANRRAQHPAPEKERQRPASQGRSGEYQDEGEEGSWINTLLPFASLILTVLMGLLAWYMMKYRIARKPIVKGISTSVMLDWDITNVYEYVSTPDFRTEWHMAAVEVNGPAIDHSAVTGSHPPGSAAHELSCECVAPPSQARGSKGSPGAVPSVRF